MSAMHPKRPELSKNYDSTFTATNRVTKATMSGSNSIRNGQIQHEFPMSEPIDNISGCGERNCKQGEEIKRPTARNIGRLGVDNKITIRAPTGNPSCGPVQHAERGKRRHIILAERPSLRAQSSAKTPPTMRVSFLVVCAALALTVAPPTIDASFIDSIPGISQIKSLVQAATGDTEGAKKTQENFVNTAPVISQIKSGVQAAQGDKEGAKKTQEQFVKNIEEVADATPIVGHIKGGIHIAVGDKERGEEIIKTASSTTGSVIGGLLGGPAGAILGGAATDALITGVDSAVNKESKPFGVWDYVVNINDKDAGEHFDQWLGLGLDALGGGAAKKPSKGGNKNKDKDTRPDEGRPDGGRPDEGRPDSPRPEFGAEQPPRGGLDEDFIHQYGPDDMRIDYSLPETMDIARRRVNLPDNYRNRLEEIDFRQVH
ncbi:unnamed protein product [Nesidiocoris tenuis]|uniref:Uncharacterized protein n=1 Tax=Nesidiocoris tenuis TaxID=355587 RepID=A0A6H5G6I4_9HEMI|nr:unnamed protein product [Nesidiocoris tenuis]